MGLSQIESKEKLTSLQVAADLISAIKDLSANPDFKQLSKDAYSIPEQDQKVADEAREKIAEYKTVLAEQKNLQKALEAEQDDIDKRSSEISDALDKLNAKATELDKRAGSLNAQDKSLTQRTVALDAREAKLSKGEATLAQAQTKLSDDQVELAKAQDALEAKAEKAKALFG